MNRSGTTKIGPLCLGTSGLGGVFGDDIDETVAANVIELCFSLGWTVIDTAPWYRNSEIVVGQALQRLRYDREKYVIATKCGRYCNSETQFDYSEETVSKSVQQSLLNLHTSYLDIVYIHDVEFQPIENTLQFALPALVKLQERGIVDRIGVSVPHCCEFYEYRFVAIHCTFSTRFYPRQTRFKSFKLIAMVLFRTTQYATLPESGLRRVCWL